MTRMDFVYQHLNIILYFRDNLLLLPESIQILAAQTRQADVYP